MVRWGVFFKYNGQIKISTRGSFYSEQAVEATKMANESPYKEAFEEMLQHGTPLVEIIYPENRVITDYGYQRKLVVLAIRRLDGTYVSLKESEEMAHANGVEHTMIIDKIPLEELLRLKKVLNWQEEGWVLVCESGLRVKVKGDEYLRIAKIKSCLSPLAVWEAMRENKAEEYIASIPDEIHAEAQSIYNNLMAQYAIVFEEYCRLSEQFGLGPRLTTDFKETAVKIQKEAPKWAHNLLFCAMRSQFDRARNLIVEMLRPVGNEYVDLNKVMK